MSGSPHIKFEQSPVESLADSFVSTPNHAYPSLFADTMDPSDVMTPQSYDDDSMFGDMQDGSMAGTPAPEKKPVKKRKSWGQQLPEPKTNLPPRKRAKTEDEKEQRRVERVLRNRRAAQSSRERKRQEVEALEAQKQAVEQTNQDLLRRLADAEAKNAVLERKLEQMSGGMNVFHSSSVASSPGASEQLRQTPRPSITFSQNLFGPRDADPQSISTQSLIDTQVVQTVNPASLSPEMGPVVESTSNAMPSDLTQHPAVSIGGAPALDGFDLNNSFDLSHFGNHAHDPYGYGGYLDLPPTSQSDSDLLNNRVLPATDQFDDFFNNLAHNNNSVFEDSQFDEFLNQDDQPAPEIQSSDSLAETTASLQPPFGASTYGCDDGSNAVSV